jgi:hypothetical protein
MVLGACFNTPRHCVRRNWHTQRSLKIRRSGPEFKPNSCRMRDKLRQLTTCAAEMGIWSCCSAGDIFSGCARTEQLSTSAAETYGRNSSEKWKLHDDFPCVLNTWWNVGDWCGLQGGAGVGAAHVTRICQAQQAYLLLFDMSCFTQAYVHTIRSPTSPPVTNRKKKFPLLMWNKQMANFGSEEWNKHKLH